MSAETLREAASLMRQRATSGSLAAPWTADVRQDGRAWVRAANPPYDLSMHGFGDDAKHIASWHPGVALAVAEWLDATAQRIEEIQDSLPFTARLTMSSLNVTAVEQALAVARAYLGGAA